MDVGELQTILTLDWKNGLIFIAALIILAVWIIQKFEFICSKLGISTKRMRKEEQQDRDIAEVKRHVEESEPKIDMLYNSIDEMKNSIKNLSDKVEAMQKIQNEARRNQLRDRIGQSYRYYAAKGEWSTLEKEAFDGLITSYEQAGGKNGTVHSVIIPASLSWKIIDE